MVTMINDDTNSIKDNDVNDINEMSWARGFFLELQRPDGAMENPMWVSVRDKVVLTKQINQATVFENVTTAITFMAKLPGNVVQEGYNLVPMQRTYNAKIHAAFWERLLAAKEELEDYSFYLIEAEHKMEQLQKALLNGPTDLAKSLSRELHTTILELAIAVDRHLSKTDGGK